MRKTLLVLLALALVGFVGQASAKTNIAHHAGYVAIHDSHMTPDTGGLRCLYCPPENNDPGWSGQFATQIGAATNPCDYFDTRSGTPSDATLDTYDCVMTWANYAYLDNVGFGNNLADFVDHGGHVILGAFSSYPVGNFLSGRIMEGTITYPSMPDGYAKYCPVNGNGNHFTTLMWDGSSPSACVHQGISSYGTFFADILTLAPTAPSPAVFGHLGAIEMANVVNCPGMVDYANGAGGYPLYPTGQDAARAANGCLCGPVSATTPSTWGEVKGLYQ